MDTKNYADMSLEELEQENIELSNERLYIIELQSEVTKFIDQKLAEKTIADKIKNMSSEEIKAMYTQLTSVMSANGASEAKING